MTPQAQRKKDLTTLKRWRSFDPCIPCKVPFLTDMPTFLRLNRQRHRVETSKGVLVPIELADKLYEWYFKILRTGGCIGDCNYRFINCTVHTANDNMLRIGDHDMPVDEIAALCRELKWSEPAKAINARELIRQGKKILIYY